MTILLAGEVGGGGVLYAAVDPDAHHVEGKVGERKFAAFLTPFASEEQARDALAAAGTRGARALYKHGKTGRVNGQA